MTGLVGRDRERATLQECVADAAAGAREWASALVTMAAGTGKDEAMAAVAHALGETALLDGAPAQLRCRASGG